VRNVLFIPIKLGNHAIGVFEVANKKHGQDFTSNDFTLLSQVADEIASGLISHEMKYNIKKEFDDQTKYYKGLMNQAYHTFLVPMITEVNQVLANVLKAEKTILFLLNKEIDHLYSLSTGSESQNVGQFALNSIRMKSSLGLAGKVRNLLRRCC